MGNMATTLPALQAGSHGTPFASSTFFHTVDDIVHCLSTRLYTPSCSYFNVNTYERTCTHFPSCFHQQEQHYFCAEDLIQMPLFCFQGVGECLCLAKVFSQSNITKAPGFDTKRRYRDILPMRPNFQFERF